MQKVRGTNKTEGNLITHSERHGVSEQRRVLQTDGEVVSVTVPALLDQELVQGLLDERIFHRNKVTLHHSAAVVELRTNLQGLSQRSPHQPDLSFSACFQTGTHPA